MLRHDLARVASDHAVEVLQTLARALIRLRRLVEVRDRRLFLAGAGVVAGYRHADWLGLVVCLNR